MGRLPLFVKYACNCTVDNFEDKIIKKHCVMHHGVFPNSGILSKIHWVHCKLLQIDYRQTKVFVCELLDFCYNYKQMLAKTTAPQTNDCRCNSWLYLNFECRQTSVYSTVKTFAVCYCVFQLERRNHCLFNSSKFHRKPLLHINIFDNINT